VKKQTLKKRGRAFQDGIRTIEEGRGLIGGNTAQRGRAMATVQEGGGEKKT